MVLLPKGIEILIRVFCRLFLLIAAIGVPFFALALMGGYEPGEDKRTSKSDTARDMRTPHAYVCVPNDHLTALRNGDTLAAEYEGSVQLQLERMIFDLNRPNSRIHLQNPDRGFVIVVRKRPERFTPHDAQYGLIALLVTVPYEYDQTDRELWCPPFSVRSPDHPLHLPEFTDSTYTAHWRPVPTLASN